MHARLGPFALLAIVVSTFAPSAISAECNVSLPNGSPAGWFRFGLAPFYDYCSLRMDSDLVTVKVRVDAIPFQKARFTVPDPPFGTIVGENWFFSHTGDRLSGLELDLAGCSTTGIVDLGEVTVSVDFGEVSPTICAPWQVGIGEVQDCTGRWLPASSIQQNLGGLNAWECMCFCWQCSYSTPPYNLYPPDGAVDVPLDVVLTWEGTNDALQCALFISTDPTCATFQTFNLTCGSFDPGTLTPNTTYYWRPSWHIDDGWGTGATAAVHSFKTEGAVSAQTATWGHVKSLYRE